MKNATLRSQRVVKVRNDPETQNTGRSGRSAKRQNLHWMKEKEKNTLQTMKLLELDEHKRLDLGSEVDLIQKDRNGPFDPIEMIRS